MVYEGAIRKTLITFEWIVIKLNKKKRKNSCPIVSTQIKYSNKNKFVFVLFEF
jgi:hypothetical protein